MVATRIVNLHELRGHRLQKVVFPDRRIDETLIESIRQNGIIEQISVSEDNIILSGARRVAAAQLAGFEKTEARVWPFEGESAQADAIWVDANLERADLSNEQRARLYAERLRIEKELAAEKRSVPAESAKPESAKSDAKDPGKRSSHRAAEAAGLKRTTAEALHDAVVEKDLAIARNDHATAEKLTQAIEKGGRPAKRAAKEAKTQRTEPKGSVENHEIDVPEKGDIEKAAEIESAKKKAVSAINRFVSLCDPLKLDEQFRSVLQACGMTTDGGGVGASGIRQPHTAEEFLAAFRRLQEDMTKRELRTALRHLTSQLLKDTDKQEYLPELPQDHVAACEMIVAEIACRTKQIRGFEQWDVAPRPKAVRSLVHKLRSAAKSIANHSRVGDSDDEQPLIPDAEWPEQLSTPEIKAAFDAWWNDRKRRKLSVSELVRKKEIKLLSRGAPDQVEAVILKATENQWQGIPDGVWDSKWCGRMAGEPAGQATHADSAAQFDQLVLAIKKHWTPDIQDMSILEKAVGARLLRIARLLGLNALLNLPVGDRGGVYLRFVAESQKP